MKPLARYVLGTLLLVLGTGVLVALSTPFATGVTMLGIAIAYAGLDLLRVRPGDMPAVSRVVQALRRLGARS